MSDWRATVRGQQDYSASKGTCCQTWQPELCLQKPMKGPIPKSCLHKALWRVHRLPGPAVLLYATSTPWFWYPRRESPGAVRIDCRVNVVVFANSSVSTNRRHAHISPGNSMSCSATCKSNDWKLQGSSWVSCVSVANQNLRGSWTWALLHGNHLWPFHDQTHQGCVAAWPTGSLAFLIAAFHLGSEADLTAKCLLWSWMIKKQPDTTLFSTI